MEMKKFLISLVVGIAVFWTGVSIASGSDIPTVDGVFGVSSVSQNSAFAVWVPLDPESSIEGFRWYNNDSSSGFIAVLAVAGEYGEPQLLADATVVAENVYGFTQGWSDFSFSQAIASGSSGLYLILQLEAGSEYKYLGLNGGVGVGYSAGSGANNCWISGDGEDWDPLDSSFQMAVVPVQNSQKSREVLRLTLPGELENPEVIEPRLASGLVSASPNPFNPKTTFHFDISDGSPTKVSVYDIRGMLVRDLINEYLEAGHHAIPWNGKDNNGRILASGRYIVRVQAGRLHSSTSVVLVK